MEGFEVRRVGGPWGNFHRSLRLSIGILNRRMKTITGPYRVKQPDGDWSGPLTRAEVRDRVERRLTGGPVGEHIRVQGTPDTQAQFTIRRFLRSLGPAVIDAGLSQLGVPYVWADEDPKGGGSSGFDCSGLTKWCYGQVGIELPHQSELQRQACTPCSPGAAKPGDLLFWGPGGANTGPADHVAIKLDDARIIDTADWAHPVAVRGIGEVWIGKGPFAAGYFDAVTGPH